MSDLETAPKPRKSVAKSKTIWTNVVIPIIPIVSPKAAAWIAQNPESAFALYSALNILLRTVSREALTLIRR